MTAELGAASQKVVAALEEQLAAVSHKATVLEEQLQASQEKVNEVEAMHLEATTAHDSIAQEMSMLQKRVEEGRAAQAQLTDEVAEVAYWKVPVLRELLDLARLTPRAVAAVRRGAVQQ